MEPEQLPPQPAITEPEIEQKSSFNKKTLLIVLTIVGLCGVILFLVLQIRNQGSNSSNNTQNTSTSTVESTNVHWLAEPKKVESVGFYKLIDQYRPFKLQYCETDEQCYDNNSYKYKTASYEDNTTYYEVGKMKALYPDAIVYMGITKNLPNSHAFKGVPSEKDVVNDLEMATLFIKTSDNKYIVTNDYRNGSMLSDQYIKEIKDPDFTKAGIEYSQTVTLDQVAYNSQIVLASGAKISVFMPEKVTFFTPDNQHLLYDNHMGHQLYTDQDFTAPSIKVKSIVHPNMSVRLPTGLLATVNDSAYESALLIQKSQDPNSYSMYDNNTQVTWTGDTKPQPLPKKPTPEGISSSFDSITYTNDYDGCRDSLKLGNVASDSESIDTTTDLTPVATTNLGETLYDIQNKKLKIYSSFWDAKVVGGGLDSDMAYGEFVNSFPILVRKDSMGMYKMMFRAELVNSQCWAEPLIYLYPEKTTAVSVRLHNSINLTESEPPYNSQWNVTAYPDGKIFDKNKQRYYPSLYWEGSAGSPYNPVSRGVVSQSNVKRYLTQTLSVLGLNQKEQTDFIAYWEPKMKSSPYYSIEFFDSLSLQDVAPLTINPKPDTLIRLLMTYKELTSDDNQHAISLDMYKTPVREGFTAVEWGGISH